LVHWKGTRINLYIISFKQFLMYELISLILVFLIGILGSFVGSMVGSGGLLIIPFLMFVGLPVQIAVATNKFASLGLSSGAFISYFRAKRIQWEYVVPFILIGIVSGYLGANILINIDTEFLTKSVGFIILLFLPFIFFKKNIGIKKTKITKVRKSIGYVFYFLAMIWGAFFGGGGGTLVFYILMMFFGFTIIDASATNKIPWFLMSLFAVILYAMNGLINLLYGVFLIAGTFIGGYLGARTAVKKGDRWVKTLFVIIVVASAVKLIFF